MLFVCVYIYLNLQLKKTCALYPPAPRCGDSDHGIYVGEWMVPRCYRIDGSEKGVLVTKQLVSC